MCNPCGVIVATMLAVTPLGTQAADLVVWWQEGYYEVEEDAIREIVTAFESKSDTQVELVLYPVPETADRAQAALDAGEPPDFLFSEDTTRKVARWAYEDRLADLEDSLGAVANWFDEDVLDYSMLLNGRTGQRGLYALPMARASNHVHVWKDLLEEVGFTLEDIPEEWDAFWSFWCDQVQPAVREATGRDDIWGIGLPMSVEASDTFIELAQFQLAHGATWISSKGELQIDDPAVRAGMIEALEDYTSVWRKDCTPPGSLEWNNGSNNQAFLDRSVVMTVNGTLSIPGALRTKRPDDYYENAVTADWPNDAAGQPLTLIGVLYRSVVFKDGGNTEAAKAFVRFLVADGWLAHWLNFSGDHFLPPMQKLLDQPFWLDPEDPHVMRSAIQTMTRPHHYAAAVKDKEAQSARVWEERVWETAVYRVAAEGISPEQAVDEAIARTKEILSQ
jgi:multiple sugar transport system substrate-binding protein